MDIIVSLIVLVVSVVLHEVAHGYAANKLGDPTAKYAGRLTLNPISHIDLFGSIILPGLFIIFNTPFLFGYAKPVPYNPYNLRYGKWGEALVALAGPATNILIAIIFALLLRIPDLSPQFMLIAASVVALNVVLAVFNMFPIPPLDGSKILFALLPDRYYRVREFLERQGFLLVLIFIIFGGTLIYPVIRFVLSLLLWELV